MVTMRKYLLSAVVALLLLCFCSGGLVLAQEQAPQGDSPKVFFYRGDELVGVDRPFGEQFGEEMVLELAKGPTDEEKAQGLSTALPDGVRLMYSTKSMASATFSVTVSSELMQLKDDPVKAERAMAQFRRTLGQIAKPENISVSIYLTEDQTVVDAEVALGLAPAQAAAQEQETSHTGIYVLIAVAAFVLVLLLAGLGLFLYRRKRKVEEGDSQVVSEENIAPARPAEDEQG